MSRFIPFITLLITFCLNCKATPSVRDTIDLKGTWYFRLHDAPLSIPAEGELTLPGTLDTNHKGVSMPVSDNTAQLSRRFTYLGDVSYFKNVEIPKEWKDKEIELFIERTRPSRVRIDGKTVGVNSKLSSPHRYNLTGFLTPGKHEIEVIVNNSDSIPGPIRRNSNQTGEYTQTAWNGMLGDILLEAKNKLSISRVRLIPNIAKRGFNAEIYPNKVTPKIIGIRAGVRDGKSVTGEIKRFAGHANMFIPVPDNYNLWSEHSPTLIPIEIVMYDEEGNTVDVIHIESGLGKLSASGNTFLINEEPAFLRGTVNAAVFPLTAHTPMDEKSWSEYFNILKSYGLNHVRFHTWCPPDAAFRAADKSGFYLQVELPVWGELDRDQVRQEKFLMPEMQGILQEYANHPSFSMFSLGNELWGDISLMQDYLAKARRLNDNPLMSAGSNVYLGMNGHIPGEDYLVAARVGDDPEGEIRGSYSFADSENGGYINASVPNTVKTYRDAIKKSPVPVISHEVGQYQSYPDFHEIGKYTGVLRPDNLTEFKERAKEAGTLRKNREYHEASSKAAARLYQHETLAALMTPGMGGFQLFGIQDYPGQGTALIGLMDAFMDSKGGIDPEKWKTTCADLVVMAQFPKFTFYEGELIKIPILTANFSARADTINEIRWKTSFAEGVFPGVSKKGLTENGEIILTLPNVKNPEKETLSLMDSNGNTYAQYDFYIYPEKSKGIKNVTVTRDINRALSLLAKGERVILCPDSTVVRDASIPPLYINDFWNYRMFRTICDKMNLPPSPGTLGLLIENTHPAFKNFPTENYTDERWHSIIMDSRPLIIDRLPQDVDPIIEVIDNTERNFRLALMLECNVGKGKLLILSTDLNKLSQSPEGNQLLHSVKEYMASKECKPDLTLTPDQVVNLLTKPSVARKVKELKNEIYDSNWD